MRVALRCDGDDRVGAGHVARALQVAAAFVRAGHEVEVVGRHEGLAADLVAGAGVPASAAARAPAGIAGGYDAVVVDSYEVDPAELRALAAAVPTAALWDGGPPPPASLLVHYHSATVPADPGDAAVLAGPAFAPVDPRFVAARRPRGLERGFVTMGGSDAGRALVDRAARALQSLGPLEVVTAGSGPGRDVGLAERAGWADVAVTGAGATAYELACAGVPAVAVAFVPNQRPVVQALATAGAVRGLDATGPEGPSRLEDEVAALGDPAVRDRLAAQGPAAVDGGGAARIRDGLLAVAAGDPVPPAITFRPARDDDAARLFAWRSDPVVRAASRSTGPLTRDGHVAWLTRTLADPARTLWIVEREGQAAGSVRFDRDGIVAEISVSLDEAHRGAGTGTRTIREATELYRAAQPEPPVVEAHVRSANAGSLAAFERAGYRPAEARGELTVLTAGPGWG